MSAATTKPPSFQTSSASAYSAATRTAGAVIALGHLLGFVSGPVVAVVGGIALMTFGRNLLVVHRAAAIAGAALAVLGGALGIAALRWGALDLGDIRGVQSVLGPTVLVGPTQAAVATGVAAGGATLALAVWATSPWPRRLGEATWWAGETLVVALAITTVFIDPAGSALGAGGGAHAALQIAWRAVVAVIVTAAAMGGAWLLRRWGELWRALVVGVAAAAVVTSAAVVSSVV